MPAPGGDEDLVGADAVAVGELGGDLAVGSLTFDAVVATRTSTPASRSASATCSEANGSSRPSSLGSGSISVTSLPSERNACASSHPTTPPPSTSSRAGTSCVIVASRLVQGSALSSPGTGGRLAVLPVATMTARRASSRSSPTRTRRSPSSLPWPRKSAMSRRSSHGSWLLSSRSWIDLIAARQRGGHVELTSHSLAGAGNAAGFGDRLRGTQQRL